MREKMKFNDLVRMTLVYIFDNRKDETEAIYKKNPVMFSEDANKGILGLLSDWRQRYGYSVTLSRIANAYSFTQVEWLVNEIKQGRLMFLDQLDERVLQVPKSHVMAYAKLVDKRVDWKRVTRYADSRNKSSLMTYLNR